MSQEEKQLTEKESLQLITEMIQKAKANIHERGTSAIMWGTSAISIFFVFVPAPLIAIAGTAAHALFP